MPAHALSAAHLPDDEAALKQLILTPAAHYETELACLRERINLLLVGK
jgi:hypothetical protein